MINKDGERALAHIEQIVDIQPIEGADKIEVATVLGWKVVVAKADNFKIGDKVVYIEIDSKVPAENPRFAFLADRHYKVKTIKLRKQISQGLIMPLTIMNSVTGLKEMTELQVGDDVTKLLGITYAVAEDNARKGKVDPNAKYKSMAARHSKLFSKQPYRWLMRRQWGKDLLFVFYGKKHDSPLQFPTHFPFVHKTDEERVENMPWILDSTDKWIKTCKVDGTSSTYILERKSFGKEEFYVLSRNVRQRTPDQKNYHTDMGSASNVYWDMAYKYHIQEFLHEMLEKHKDWKYVCLQGETAGPNVQANPHGLKEVCFFGFNFIDSVNGRWNTVEAAELCRKYNIPWVPIIDVAYELPHDMEEMKLSADGKCDILGSTGLREGFVYRSQDGKQSFKNVSRKYLLKQGE